jgi:hypothetical protein
MADGVDTSIYKNTATPLDPLKMFGQVMSAQNMQGQNRLLQQQQDLRSGMTDAYRQAWDPVTKQVDVNKLGGLVTGDPRTGWNSGDVLAQAYGNQTAQATAQQDQLKNALAHLEAGNGVLTGLLANPGAGKTDLTKEAKASFFDLVSNPQFGITPDQANKVMKTFPADPAAQKVWLQNMANQNMSLRGQYRDMVGPIQPVGTGGNTTLLQTGAAGGAPQVVGQLPNTLSPGEKVTGQPTFGSPGPDPSDPTGKTMLPAQAGTVPVGSRFTPTGDLRSAPGQPPAAPFGRPVNRLTGTNVQPTPAQTAAVTAATKADDAQHPRGPAAAGGAPGFLPTAQSPAAAAQLQADQTQYFGDLSNAPKHVTNVQNLDLAREAMGLSDQGKSTGATHALYSFLNAQGMLVGPLKFLKDDVKNYDVFNKLTTDYAAKAAGTGGLTDLSREMSTASNAGTGLSKAANDVVIKKNIGLENQAIASVMEQGDKTGAGHIDRSAKFANDTDPHAFAWNRYTPEERDAYIAQLKKAGGNGYTKLLKSLEIAHKHGLIPGPQ